MPWRRRLEVRHPQIPRCLSDEHMRVVADVDYVFGTRQSGIYFACESLPRNDIKSQRKPLQFHESSCYDTQPCTNIHLRWGWKTLRKSSQRGRRLNLSQGTAAIVLMTTGERVSIDTIIAPAGIETTTSMRSADTDTNAIVIANMTKRESVGTGSGSVANLLRNRLLQSMRT
jgi:hypothetical protein